MDGCVGRWTQSAGLCRCRACPWCAAESPQHAGAGLPHACAGGHASSSQAWAGNVQALLMYPMLAGTSKGE